MKDRKARREHVELVAIGAPLLTSGRAAAMLAGSDRDLFYLEFAAVTDDTRRGRVTDTGVMLDGAFLRQLVASARASGWTE
ncbi:MAG: hypothetical protein AB1627_15380 [Chloroflexota bacterium]